MISEYAFKQCFISSAYENGKGNPANVVDGLFELSSVIRYAARHLGKEDASDPMGAIEHLGKCVLDGSVCWMEVNELLMR